MYSKIQYNCGMYVKIQINSVYKIQLTSLEDSVTENHHARVIPMIQYFVSRFQVRHMPCHKYIT